MKYEFTGETINHYGATLKRIRVIKDFGNVKKGDLGGFIESEKNLSTDSDNACVYDNARVKKTPIFISGLRHHITITEKKYNNRLHVFEYGAMEEKY